MANTIGTAWIQIKPTLKGISGEIESQLGKSGTKASNSFSNGFKNNFLNAAKSSFDSAFSEFRRRSENTFNNFARTAKVGFVAAGVGVVALAKQLDSASGSQKAFEANMKLAGMTTKQTAETFNLLQNYANKSIYSLTDMTATAGILASTGVKNSGLLVKAFGNLAAAAESPAQAIKSISQQMAQVNGKGFVQTMDFRIMQEQAAGPMKLVQQRIMELNNLDMAGFMDALSKGKISADQLNEAMLYVGQNKTLDDLATKPKTIGAAWEGLTSTFIANLATSQEWADVQQRVVNIMGRLADWVGKNKDQIAKFVGSIVDAATGAAKWIKENKELVKIVVSAVVAYKGLQLAVGGYMSVMRTLSPFVKVAKGSFQLLAGGVSSLSGKFKGINSSATTASSGLSKVSTVTKNTGTSISNVFTSVLNNISKFLINLKEVLIQAVKVIVEPIKILLKGVGEAIAGFFLAFANPTIILGAGVFAVAAIAIAVAIAAISAAVGFATPILSNLMNTVLIPAGNWMLNTLLVILQSVTNAIVALTNRAIIPLVNVIYGSFVGAMQSVGTFIQRVGNTVSRVVDSISGGISRVINSIANLIRSISGQDWYGTGFGITRNFSGGIVDGLTSFIQDGLNNIINSLLNTKVIGKAPKTIGVKRSPINLSSFRMGRRADGGAVFGPGTSTSDSIPMALSNGEYVIKAASARRIGYANLDAINSTGRVGKTVNVGDININGYNKDPRELAKEISRIIAFEGRRVMG